MCAISGILTKKGISENDTEAMIRMVASQIHRGPDDRGICGISESMIAEYSAEKVERCKDGTKVLLGHNRLSILDISDAGHQPMKNDDGTIVIVYNGEVYNAFEEKENLVRKGHTFKSNTDTEIILKLYQEYGIEDTLRRLNGMFAFCIYDWKHHKAYMARDRFGIKPFYFYEDENVFLFGSEIKSILKSGKISIEIDKIGFQETFTFGNSFRRSIVKGIRSLQPGEYLVWENEKSTSRHFFDINEYNRSGLKQSKNANKQTCEKMIKESVKRQMISDVKLGCQLSGGVDSSLISCFASHNDEFAMKDSIAVIFDDAYGELNEEKYIDMASRKLGLECHKKELDADFFIGNLEKINWHLENIPAYYNELGILLLSREAKEHVTVLLSGEGADELFAGYARMAYSEIVNVASRMHRVLPNLIKSRIWKGRRSNRYIDYIVFKEAVPLPICRRLFANYKDEVVSRDRIEYARKLKGTSLDMQRKYEMSVRLQGLLNRQDKSTMANSIENRVPFLDNRVVDWAFSLPRSALLKIRIRDLLKNKGTRIQGKYILKSICADYFGDNFAFRDKGGFEVPCREYMQTAKFKEYVRNTVLPGIKRRKLMDYQCIKKWFENLDDTTSLEENALWRALNLEILCQLMIDGREYQTIT